MYVINIILLSTSLFSSWLLFCTVQGQLQGKKRIHYRGWGSDNDEQCVNYGTLYTLTGGGGGQGNTQHISKHYCL